MKYCQSLLLVILAAGLHAQTFRGALSGTVTDSSGAALAESAVKLEKASTGFTRGTTSTGNGDFFFADLPLGIYTLTVAHPGFEEKKVWNIEIAVSKTTNINVELGVARQQQMVEVSATSVHLNTTSSDLAAVVSTREVQDLPINGWDFRQMIKLSPGVTSSASPSVNGTRTVSNNYFPSTARAGHGRQMPRSRALSKPLPISWPASRAIPTEQPSIVGSPNPSF